MRIGPNSHPTRVRYFFRHDGREQYVMTVNPRTGEEWLVKKCWDYDQQADEETFSQRTITDESKIAELKAFITDLNLYEIGKIIVSFGRENFMKFVVTMTGKYSIIVRSKQLGERYYRLYDRYPPDANDDNDLIWSKSWAYLPEE